jgi:ureidoglycolate hydrolase
MPAVKSHVLRAQTFLSPTTTTTSILERTPLGQQTSALNPRKYLITMADVDEDVIPRTGPSADDIDLSDETQDFRFLAALS